MKGHAKNSRNNHEIIVTCKIPIDNQERGKLCLIQYFVHGVAGKIVV